MLILEALVALIHAVLMGRVVRGDIELIVSSLYLKALGSRRDHAALAHIVGSLLLLELALLLLEFLLLQVLDLGVNLRDGIAGRMRRREHRGGDARVRGGRAHGHLVVHRGVHLRQEHLAIRARHGRVDRLALRRGAHHGLAVGILEILEIELQPVAEVSNAVHVEELLEVILRGRM